METDNRLPTGEWNGFYLEQHQPRRGWMHLYMSFADGNIKGEGTDYVGPWVANGSYDTETGMATWVKQYLGKHQVGYRGKISDQGIMGEWDIHHMSGEFHIWPKSLNHLNELFLTEDMTEPVPQPQTIPLGTVVDEEFAGIA